MVEQLLRINMDTELLTNSIDPSSICNLITEIISRNLKPSSRLKHINRGGPKLLKKRETMNLGNLRLKPEVNKDKSRKTTAITAITAVTVCSKKETPQQNAESIMGSTSGGTALATGTT